MPLIRPGHQIKDDRKRLPKKSFNGLFENYSGTLGIIMKSESSSGEETYVALTAGHILPEYGEDRVYVQSPRNPGRPMIQLKIPQSCRRNSGDALATDPNTVLDEDIRQECAFLVIKRLDLKHFSLGIYQLSCHHLSDKDPDDNRFDRDHDPISTDERCRRNFIEQKMVSGNLRVYKNGATTGPTQGYLAKILDLDSIPEELGPPDNDLLDDNEWLGIVKWTHPNEPFGRPGDSGSLVYAKEDGKMIPLGIHLGRWLQDGPDYSYFLSLETYCFNAEKEGWELKLPYYDKSRDALSYWKCSHCGKKAARAPKRGKRRCGRPCKASSAMTKKHVAAAVKLETAAKHMVASSKYESDSESHSESGIILELDLESYSESEREFDLESESESE
jgi:hypothetical protein